MSMLVPVLVLVVLMLVFGEKKRQVHTRAKSFASPPLELMIVVLCAEFGTTPPPTSPLQPISIDESKEENRDGGKGVMRPESMGHSK
jgi:hypothetical protein